MLAVVVDDLSLSYVSTVNTRKMLTRFVERDVAPGDLVAILRTSGGAGTLQQFTTDRRLLAAAIERVQWVGRLARFAAATEARQMPLGDDDDLEEQLAADLLVEGSIGALNYAVRGVESLPGRKTVVFVSEGMSMRQPAQQHREGPATGDRPRQPRRRRALRPRPERPRDDDPQRGERRRPAANAELHQRAIATAPGRAAAGRWNRPP